MKKLLFCSVLPLCTYAADQSNAPVKKEPLETWSSLGAAVQEIEANSDKKPYSALAEYVQEIESEEKFGGPINPSTFDDKSKLGATEYIATFVTVAEKNDIKTGLATPFFTLHNDGIEKLVNNEAILKRANGYYKSYQSSPSAALESDIRNKFKAGSNDNRCYEGAEEEQNDAILVTQLKELHNIMFKRGEAPIMPKNDLTRFYLAPLEKTALISLKLNKDNDKLSYITIGAFVLTRIYMTKDDHAVLF